jgi:formate-dependent nitrite reductase membrane component NrfD
VALALVAAAVAMFGRKRPSVAAAGALAIVAVFLIRISSLLWGVWDFP